MRVRDLVGQRFGFLLVLRRDGNVPRPYKGRTRRGNATWWVRCDCGQELSVKGYLLVCGRKKSCARDGHFWRPVYVPRPQDEVSARKLNLSEYRSWCKMRERCRDKKNKRYGGRGISLDKRWRSFDNFLADMGPKPTPQHTIERKDVNGNYEPGNCRWATKDEQRRNQRRSVYIEFNGQRVLLMDVTKQLGLDRNVVYGRLKMGWSLPEALLLSKRAKRKS